MSWHTDWNLGTQLVYQMYCEGMSIPLKRQGLLAANLYDLVVSAEPLDLDSSAVASLADKAYVAIRDRLIMLDIRPGDPIDDDDLAKDLGVGRTPVREGRQSGRVRVEVQRRNSHVRIVVREGR